MDTGNRDWITRRDASVACLVSLLLGAMLSALVLLGSDVPLKCFEAGNVADWLAALGTWVIGYGAWKYARDNYRHGKEEAQRRAAQENSRTIARIDAMVGICNQMLAVAGLVMDPPKIYRSAGAKLKVETLLSVALAWLDDADWGDVDKALLTKEAGSDLRQLRLALLGFRSAVMHTEGYLAKGGEVSDEEEWGKGRWANALMESCKSLETRAGAFKKRLLELRKAAEG